MTKLLKVGDKIRCINEYSTSTTKGNVYEIALVVESTPSGRVTYSYVDDDADDDNMENIARGNLTAHFEVVDRHENVSTNEMKFRDAEALCAKVCGEESRSMREAEASAYAKYGNPYEEQFATPVGNEIGAEAPPSVTDLLANLALRVSELERHNREQAYEINELYKAVSA